MKSLAALVVMGVCGSGKTTVGIRLAAALGVPFYDADDFHPGVNKKKMAAGLPLNDEDREPWLSSLGNLIKDNLETGQSVVLACSALKQAYRGRLASGDPRVRFIYLKGGMDLFRQRMEARKNHYMKAGMLESQFAALEEPEKALTVDASLAPGEAVSFILGKL